MSKKKEWSQASKAIHVQTYEDRRMVYPSHSVGGGGRLVKPEQKLKKGMSFDFRRRGRLFNGQTAFYRQSNAMHQMINWVAEQSKNNVRMLVMPSSIGCESYTFAMMAANEGLCEKLSIDSFDISDEFLRVARKGVYPSGALLGLPNELLKHFDLSTDRKYAEVSCDVKKRVNFLSHCSLEKFNAKEPYDMVISQNFLKHVEGAPWDKSKDVKRQGYNHKQAAAIKNLCDLTAENGVLFVDMIEETPFAFHREFLPFNPFKDNGMIYLNADLKPYRGGNVYPRKSSEVYKSIGQRNLVHALQKCSISI